MQSDHLAPGAESAISPGVRLRRAREARGESVHEAAFAIKLSPRQIEALENDDFAALPGMAFVRGFARNYARYLGLDAAPLLDGIERLAGADQPDLSPIRNADGDLPSGGGGRRGSFPAGAVVAVLLVLLGVGWYFDWFRTEPVTEVVEPAPSFAPAPAQPLEEPVASPPVLAPSVAPVGAENDAGAASADVLTGAAADASSADADAAGVTDAAPEGVAATAPTPGETPSAVDGAVDAPSAADVPSDPQAPANASDAVGVDGAVAASAETAASTDEATPGAAAAGQLSFRFSADSWVEVRDGSGSILHSGTNRAGSSRTVQGAPPFALVVGNSASVTLEHDGKPIDLAAHTRGSVARLTLR